MPDDSTPPVCSLPDCDRPAERPARPPWVGRWCQAHDGRYRRHGDPRAGGAARRATPPPIVDGRVPLHDGRFALVDIADVPSVAGRSWSANSEGYVVSGAGKLHRVILGYGPNDPDVDHVNGDRLDNRRENLRPATIAQNAANGRGRSVGASGYRGVVRKPSGRYEARIRKDGGLRYLGTFDTAAAAAAAYDRAALERWGEYAWTNKRRGMLPDERRTQRGPIPASERRNR